jgi:copper oxidase (laccase) domain-containing protein
MREEVAAVEPATRSVTSWDTPALDLGAGVRAQLVREGEIDLQELGECTRESPRWPSHRRDGQRAARFAGVVWRV